MSRTRRVVSTLAVAALVLLAGVRPADSAGTAAPIPNGFYQGFSSDLGRVNVSVTPDGSALQTFTRINPPVVRGSCVDRVDFNRLYGEFTVPVVDSVFDTGPLEVGPERLLLRGTFSDAGLVSGEFRSRSSGSSPYANLPCPPRDVQWIAVAPVGSEPPLRGVVFSGVASAGGTVRFTTAVDGASAVGVELQLLPRCASFSTYQIPLDNGTGGYALVTGGRLPVIGQIRIAISGDRASGVYAIDRGDVECGPQIGSFTARAGGSPPASPGASGVSITSGAIPSTGGFGLVVFGGGSLAQLVSLTGCPVMSMALYVAREGGFLAYVPGTPIGAVNQSFLDAFPLGIIPPSTVFLGRCI